MQNELVQLTLWPAALRAPGHSAANHGVGKHWTDEVQTRRQAIQYRAV